MWCFDRMICHGDGEVPVRFLGGPAEDFTPRHSRAQAMAESAPDGPVLTHYQNIPSTTIASPFFSVYLYPPPTICIFLPSIITTLNQ